MKLMIKAIIFDFYGVIRSDDYHNWLSRHGFKNDNKASMTKDQDAGIKTSDQFFEALSIMSHMPADKIKKEFNNRASLNEKLLALILNLKNNYKIAILSNANSDSLRNILKDASIEQLFDEVIISSEIGIIKPSPEIFTHALRKLQVEPNEAIFIDDNPEFVDAATKLGITGICFTDFNPLVGQLKKIGLKF